MSERNLVDMFKRADVVDTREGLLAYERYHKIMVQISARWNVPLERVVAVFCALSPNNDYDGNLRSLVSVLHGMRVGWGVDEIEVSTYRHCLHRAWEYAHGKPFLAYVKGLKIRNFYVNVLDPENNQWVTIDGHMVAIWRGQNLTMKEAICRSSREYNEIANACKRLAFELFMRPNQFQAILWFVRKRVFNIKQGNASQYDLLMPDDLDMWRTSRDVEAIKIFPRRDPNKVRVQTYTHKQRKRPNRDIEQTRKTGLEGLWGRPGHDEIG